MKSGNLFSQKYIEDELKQGTLGQPSPNEHYHIHLRGKQSLWNQIWACHDMFWDHHWESKNTLHYSFKGALVGAAIGSSVALTFRQLPTIVLKKLFTYVRQNDFGHLKQ